MKGTARLAGLVAVGVAMAIAHPAGARANSSTPAAGAACAPTGDLNYICGVKNVEDLVPIAGGRWLVGGSNAPNSVGLYLIDTESRTVRPVSLSIATKSDPTYSCAPPDLGNLMTHGLDVWEDGSGKVTVFAVNHGGREAVEVFRLDPAKNSAQWTGCVIAPPQVSLNSVAALGDGRIAMTKLLAAPTVEEFNKLLAGMETGVILIWTPGEGFAELPGSQLNGNNGLLRSRDGQSLYVAEWGAQKVWRLPLSGSGERTSVKLDFWPDNIRWSADGGLFVTGQFLKPKFGTGQVLTPENFGEPPAWATVRLDPDLQTITPVAQESARPEFGHGGTATVQAGDAIWFAFGLAERIAYRVQH